MIWPTNTEFPILGGYDNPAGLAANLAFTFPLLFAFIREFKALSCIFVLVVLLALILSDSRAGLLSVIVVSSIYFSQNLPAKLKVYKKYVFGAITVLAILFSTYLFFLKQDSAIGRTLIWQVTGNLVATSIMFGEGSYGFHKDYMLHQANYFVRHPDSGYEVLAGNITHPFNEYLLLIVKYGLLAFVTVMYGLLLLVRNTRWNSPYLLCLISIGVFSLFSYPFRYPITWIVLIYSVVQVSNKIEPVIYLPRKKTGLFIIPFLCVAWYCLIKDMRFEYIWNKTATRSLTGQTREMQPRYEELYHNWNGNHLFLYNYAAELNQLGENRKSLEILDDAVQYWNDYDIQMLYAYNCQKLGEWARAEKHLKLASNMCPNRFLPLFNLHEVYVNTQRNDDALNIAKHIIDKNVKIPSATIYSIKAQMKRYMEEDSRK
jgi:hypothetical protein